MPLGFDPARKTAFSPSSLATAVNQAIGNLLISAIEAKMPALVNGAIPVVQISTSSNARLVRCDSTLFTTVYVGKAPLNTSESSAGWSIIRTTYSSIGVLQTSKAATGAWASRSTLTYT
jgi:hypothetical protein